MDKKESLVDFIATELNVIYLSDIRQKEYYSLLHDYLSTLNQSDFDKEEWEKLYAYLSSEQIDNQSLDEVYNMLLDYLSNEQ